MPVTSAEAVLHILELLGAAGADPIVGGGWGIDALVGSPGRIHADLDVTVEAGREAACITVLEGAGFVATLDWRPIRLALTHPSGPEVDLHPAALRDDGTLIQQGIGTTTYEIPLSEVTTGTIAGTSVRCLSARLQMQFHDGYQPSPVDVADCLRLAEASGLPLPASIRSAMSP